MKIFALLAFSFAAIAFAEDKADLAVVHRIKAEAFQHSQVMDHLFWLTDANGPRLTGSPGFRRAADWAMTTLKGFGSSNVHLEKWGRIGPSWLVEQVSLTLDKPVYATLHATPLAWSGGTQGPTNAELLLAPISTKATENDWYELARYTARTDRYIAQWHGKLDGKLVLMSEERELELPKEPAGSRYDDAKLTELEAFEPLAPKWEWPVTKLPFDDKKREALFSSWPIEVEMDYFLKLDRENLRLLDFLKAEGAKAALWTDSRGEGAITFAEGPSTLAPGRQPLPSLVLPPEDYNRLARLARKQIGASASLDLKVTFDEKNSDGSNVIAEIAGGKKKDELVMLGGHLDSWHAATGATDNAAGVAVAIEAFRILQALKLPMDRTVRLALWSGEEQGYYGSRGYVKEHFGDEVTMKLKPDHARLSAYFNVDNGSGKLRGVYLQGNDMARPIFEAWLAPFKDEGVATISIHNTGSTDHVSFDDVGLPAFQFIQDPLDYSTRTHHSTLDVYDHALPADLMQSAAVLASVVYAAANRPEKLPRKPLPKPLPPKKDLKGITP